MININVRSWEQFKDRLQKLVDERLQRKNSTSLHVSPFLYRGQGNHKWKLMTTLERNKQNDLALKQYYRLISVVKPQIETFTGVTWNILQYQEYEQWLHDNDTRMPGNFPAYDYMVYLRHHGFPSPLLDWTRSPYIAAYFAFNNITDDKGKVSIYVFWEYLGSAKVWSSAVPHIHSLGPYVRSHRRHFLQQSEYTICMVRNNEWCFVPHEAAFAHSEPQQDILWMFNIPATEWLKVLKKIDSYNLNAFSLFGSKEISNNRGQWGRTKISSKI